MNPKIEVDHKLFTTCRLCLDEKGKYQIVPTIQKNIKFAFDIEVELNNGLPQLICVKCESLLSQFVCTKQLFQEKQKGLQSRRQQVNPVRDGKQPHQKSENSTQQTDNDQDSETRPESVPATDSASADKSGDSDNPKIIKKIKITRDKSWRGDFIKYFACRFCSKTFEEKKGILNHIKRHDMLLFNFKNIVSPCFIKLEKIDKKPNVTGSKKFVMLHGNRIMQYKKSYYNVVYSHKSNNSYIATSDEDEKIRYKKCKRRRLGSESSHDTLVIEEKGSENETDIETTKIDSPLKGTGESEAESEDKAENKVNKVVIDNIVTVCYNKILSKIEKECNPNFKNKSDKQSQLRHKVLSIGSKILNNNPLNCTGLLRYLEYKNLDVIPKIIHPNESNYVRIHTKLRGKQNSKNNNTNWKNLNNALNIETMLEFSAALSEALNSETCNEEKSGTASNVTIAKLLNANPVANPKQLPKKSVVEVVTSIQKSLENSDNNSGQDKSVHNITSKQNDSVIESNNLSGSTIDSNKRIQVPYPLIKVKDVSELMPKYTNVNHNTNHNQSLFCYSSPFNFQSGSATNESSAISQPITSNYSTNINSLKTVQNYVNIAPAVTKPPQPHTGSTYTNNREFAISKKNPEYITLHTVEFPNSNTKSPFQYLKNLLAMHNIFLLDSKEKLTPQSKCLIKFKLSFQQENAIPVTLCLSLFSDVLTFCVKVTNNDGVDIDIRKMTAYWQWEILRAFRGEIVPQLFRNAFNINPSMLEATKKFINYLKSIEPISIE